MEKAFKAFMSGIKPAYLCHHDYIGFYQRLVDLDFPKVQIRHDLTLFFQSNQLRDQFLVRSEGLEPGTPEHHRILGEALGYPPLAAKFFAESWVDRSLWEKSATFKYCGYQFNGHIDDVIPIAEWLWSNVPIPPSEVKIITLTGKEYRLSPNLWYNNKHQHFFLICSLRCLRRELYFFLGSQSALRSDHPADAQLIWQSAYPPAPGKAEPKVESDHQAFSSEASCPLLYERGGSISGSNSYGSLRTIRS